MRCSGFRLKVKPAGRYCISPEAEWATAALQSAAKTNIVFHNCINLKFLLPESNIAHKLSLGKGKVKLHSVTNVQAVYVSTGCIYRAGQTMLVYSMSI